MHNFCYQGATSVDPNKDPADPHAPCQEAGYLGGICPAGRITVVKLKNIGQLNAC